jgi:hypothetical protein
LETPSVTLIPWTPTAVPRRYADKVQLQSVLVPLVGRDIKGLLADDRAIIERTLALVESWRRRLHALSGAGWTGLGGETPAGVRNRAFAANCRPSFVITAQRARCCRKQRRLGRSNYDLIEHRETFTFPPLIRIDGVQRETLPEMLRIKASSRSWRMKERMAIPGMMGAFEVVIPSVTRDNLWRVEVRGLFITLPGFVVPESWSASPPRPNRTGGIEESKLRRHERPKRKDVVDAVARTYRYPTSLLRGNRHSVAGLLNTRRRLKLSEMFGAFRNRASRIRQDQGG